MVAADDTVEIRKASLYRYRVECVRPLRLRDNFLTQREGLILELFDDQNNRGLGEVAPLPGFSRENLACALEQLRFCCERLVVVRLDRDRELGLEAFFPGSETLMPGVIEMYPSVRMGLELAVCELLSQRCRRRVADWLNPGGSIEPVSCPLLSGNHDEIIRKAKRLAARRDLRQVKLKVGRRSPEQDARLLHQLADLCGDSIRFRLDANRQWSYREALRFARLAPRQRILYVEEPTSNLLESRRFCAETDVPIALDETLQDPGYRPEPFPELAALVVKPTLCGGLGKTFGLVRLGQRWGVQLLVSSSFESSLGIGQLAELAAALTPGQPAGLDTFDAFAEDIVRRYGESARRLVPLERLERVWTGSPRL